MRSSNQILDESPTRKQTLESMFCTLRQSVVDPIKISLRPMGITDDEYEEYKEALKREVAEAKLTPKVEPDTNFVPCRNGIPVFANFTAGWGSSGAIWVENTVCDVCVEQTWCLCVDSSNEEYGPGCICLDCVNLAFDKAGEVNQ